METDAVVTPMEIWIGIDGGTKLEVGNEVREPLRRTQIKALHEALVEVKACEEAMPAFDDPTVRAMIESLEVALRCASNAASALWFLAPDYDDGEPVE